MQIIIGGDLVPTKLNVDYFIDADMGKIIGDGLGSILRAADVRIFNLETPLTDKQNPIDKCGPNLLAPASTINGIIELNPTLLTLANNHILDHGVEGLEKTLELLAKHHIQHVGVGNCLNEAKTPHIISENGIKIGVYACAEHEFSIASEKSPGANPFDPLESLDHISSLKEMCDYVIVLHHGGKEHYRYPSPLLQKTARKMVDKGANLVICQHSHCIGCYEEYAGSTIVYGQGNFIFIGDNNECFNSGLLVCPAFSEGISIDYIPIVSTERGIRLATDEEGKTILGEFHERSKEIVQEGFIEQQYTAFAVRSIDLYLRKLSGMGKWTSRIDRYLLNGKLLKSKYEKKKIYAITNYIESEAHRELLITGLKVNGLHSIRNSVRKGRHRKE